MRAATQQKLNKTELKELQRILALDPRGLDSCSEVSFGGVKNEIRSYDATEHFTGANGTK